MCSPTRTSLRISRTVAARSATYSRSRGLDWSTWSTSCNQRGSTQRGSSTKASRSAGFRAAAVLPSGPGSSFQANSPSVSTTSNRCGDLLASHHATSRSTHGDRAASGEAISTSHAEEASAFSMDDHRPGWADRLAVSRNTRSARGRYHGFANRSNPTCSACAKVPSSA
jgi:hypothetical protein